MRKKLRDLYDQRAAAWSQVQEIQTRRSAAGYDPTAEDGETYTRALDDVERLSQEIETEERADRLEASFNAVAGDQRSTNPVVGAGETTDADQGVEAYRSAFAHYLRSGMNSLSADEQRLMEQGFVDVENRAQGVSSDTAGGYTVPETFLQRMTEAQVSFGGLLALAEIIDTSTGNDLRWPTNNDTANKGAILAENTQVTEQDTTFGSTTLGGYMYTSKMIRVSRQLLQDSAFNLDAWLARKDGERIGRAAAEHFAIGTGVNQPQGLLTGLTKVVHSGTAGKVSYDNLVDLEHAIDPAYRGNAQYVLADSALRELRKLKDSQNRPLWVPALAGGVPSTINGRPYTIDNSFPATADGTRSVVFGDIRSAYVVRRIAGAQTLRLTERYADFLQVGFLGFQRFDGKVQDTSAAAALVLGAAPAP